MSEVFHTDTGKVKKTILGTALFIMAAFFAASLIGEHTLPDAILYSLVFSAAFLITFLTYGRFAMFGRSYLVSAEGITLLKSDRPRKHIPWDQLKGISKGHLVAISKEGVKISFNLPPKLQMDAREAIKRVRQSKAETDVKPRHAHDTP